MNNNTTKNFKNMKKCKSLRTLIVAGSLALLSIVNVSILTMRDTRVKSLVATEVNADAEELGPWGFLIWLTEFCYDNFGSHFKFHEFYTVCNPMELSKGSFANGSQADHNFRSAIGGEISGNTSISGTKATAHGDVDYSANISNYNANSYSYQVIISLPGDHWKVKLCEPCSANDPQRIQGSCQDYDACAITMKSRIAAYKTAFSVN